MGQDLGHAVLQDREIVPGQAEDRRSPAVADRGVDVDQPDLFVLADVDRARHQGRLAPAAEGVDRHGAQRLLHEPAAGVPGQGVGWALENAQERPVRLDLDTHDAGVGGGRSLDPDARLAEDETGWCRLEEPHGHRRGRGRRGGFGRLVCARSGRHAAPDRGDGVQGGDQYDRAK